MGIDTELEDIYFAMIMIFSLRSRLSAATGILGVATIFIATAMSQVNNVSSPQAKTGCQVSLQTLKANLGGYCRGPSRSRVIVFVNGIFGDAVDTWSNGASYWPDMLAKDPTFDDSDIYVHSFQSPLLTSAQEIDELAGRMTDFLSVDGIFAKHKEVVFICHSMGGLITRAYLLKTLPPPRSVPMIYFYATPTTGANIAGIAAHLSQNPQLKYMLPLDENGYVGDLQNAWLRTSIEASVNYPAEIASYCAYELIDTWGFRVVTRESATNLCNHETRAVRTDHIGIVKPKSEFDDPYVYFKAAYLYTFGSASIRARSIIQKGKTFAQGTSSTTDFVADSNKFSVLGFRRQLSGAVCGQEKIEKMVVPYSIPDEDEILEVLPTIGESTRLSDGVGHVLGFGVGDVSRTTLGNTLSVALVSYDRHSARVTYRLRGGTKTRCSTLQSADIVINIVVTSPRQNELARLYAVHSPVAGN